MTIVRVAHAGENLNQRKARYPKQPFALQMRPTQLVPFAFHPVLPGETLTSMNVQARLVTDPIKDRLTGWWAEMWAFYVKLTDIDPDLAHQFLPGEAITRSNYQETADNVKYFQVGSVTHPAHNWLEQCVDRIVAEWFHMPGQTGTLDGYHQRRIIGDLWIQSMIEQSDVTDPAIGTTAEDVDDQIEAFRAMLRDQMADMTWNDYLKQYGIRAVNTERGVPEPIMQKRNWAYPSNTIDPTDGSAVSAVSWILEGNIGNKRILAREPGFIVGIMCYTPKVYRLGVEGTLTSEMWGPEYWMSPLHVPEPHLSIKELAAGHDLLSTLTGPVNYDLADLFMHGEEFRNYTPTAHVSLPTDSDLQAEFMPSADIDDLFVAAEPTVYAQCDGITAYTIQSMLRDHT